MFRSLLLISYILNHAYSFVNLQQHTHTFVNTKQKQFDSKVSPLSLFRRRRGGRGALDPPPPPQVPQQQQQQPVMTQQTQVAPIVNPNLGAPSTTESPTATTTNAFSQQRDMLGKRVVGRAGRRITLRRYLNGLVKKHPEVSRF